jgi:hypothetical protein
MTRIVLVLNNQQSTRPQINRWQSLWMSGDVVWQVPFSNLGATRHRMTLDKSLLAVGLRSPGRCILITSDIHRPLWPVSVYGESTEKLRQAGLLSRAIASHSCRTNIRLSIGFQTAPYTGMRDFLSNR